MIRLFKHYIPHAVLLLGLFDFVAAGRGGRAGVGAARNADRDRCRRLRASGSMSARAPAAIVLAAMIAVGVYGADSLRSMRYAAARLLVAVSLGIIALTFIDFLIPGQTFWRSTLAYAMGLSIDCADAQPAASSAVSSGLRRSAAGCWCSVQAGARSACVN